MPRPQTLSIYLLVYDTGGASTDRASFGQRLAQFVTFFKRAVDIANANPPARPAQHLNLFMAPEFYLNQGISALSQQQWSAAINTLNALSAQYPRWLLLPGTALWEHVYKQNGNNRYNTAPVFFQGNLIHAYCKRYPGDTERSGTAHWNTEYPLGNVASDPVFAVEGVLFGIEICNDYRQAAFSTYFDKTYGATPGPGRPPWVTEYGQKPGVDVQLLPSNGVSPMEVSSYVDATTGVQRRLYFDNVRIRPNGYFVVCEGAYPANNPGAMYHRKTVVYKRTARGFTTLRQRPAEQIISARDSTHFVTKGFWPVPGSLDTTPLNPTSPMAPILCFPHLPLEARAP